MDPYNVDYYGGDPYQKQALLSQMGTPTAQPNTWGATSSPYQTSMPNQTSVPTKAPTATAPAPAAQPSSSWDTNGYSAPKYTAPTGNVLNGWDAGKWADPNHQSPKYAVGHILSGYPPTVAGLTQAFAQIQKAYPGATFNGKDTVTIPGVGAIDVLQGVAWQWLDKAHAGGAGAAGGAGGAGGGGAWGSAGAPGSYASLWAQVMKQAQQGTNIDTNDPNFRRQADTFAAAQERARRDTVANDAEAYNAQNLGSSGAHTAEDRLVNERAMQSRAGFEAELGARELQNRRAEIQQALQLGTGMMNAEQQRALTAELTKLDLALREKLANNELGYNYSALESNQNRAALLALMGGA